MLDHIMLPNLPFPVTRVALGGCPLGGHGWGAVDDQESLATVRAALDAGITFYDTADVYGLGHSEDILARGLGEQRHRVVIATKFGVRRTRDGKSFYDASPLWARQAVEGSLRRLKVEAIPLYYMHWPDGKTPIEEVVGALADLKREGKILGIGLSNACPDDVARAASITSVSAVQIQYSLVDRAEAEAMLPVTRRHGIPLVTWGSLAQGLLGGKYDESSTFPATDRRSRYANFQPPKLARNLTVARRVRDVAKACGVSPSAVAIRWLLERTGVGVVLFGAKSPRQVNDNCRSLGWCLTAEQRRHLNDLTRVSEIHPQAA